MIIPGFEEYFTGENEDKTDDDTTSTHGDISDETGDESEVNTLTSTNISAEIIVNMVKQSFDNISSRSELRIPCLADTLQFVVHDGLREATCVKHTVVK